jgi:hypothetical protein
MIILFLLFGPKSSQKNRRRGDLRHLVSFGFYLVQPQALDFRPKIPEAKFKAKSAD